MELHEPSQSPLVSPAYREICHATPGAALLGFLPAFMDARTLETHLSVDERGTPAAVHLLDRLPDHWVAERDAAGRIAALKDGIIAGFMRQGQFFTRSEISRLRCDA